MPSAIEVSGLVKRFPRGVLALDGVSFDVERGTVFGLLGPNGAGKTTVVRILTTILRPDEGGAKVLGRDVVREPELVRSLFGLAGQYAAVDENLTGRENLRMVGRLNHLPRPVVATRSKELLDQFELTDAADRTLKTYSGGMRRRLDLAAALVARPEVLFLDEPTTGLDPPARIGLWGVIEGLVETGTTVLLTTQYLEEADRLASRVAVVDHGRVIAEGTPAALKADLGATVLEVGLSDADTAARAAQLLESVSAKRPRVLGNDVELPADGGAAVATDALRALDRAGIVPLRFSLREPSLDDVFLTLTGHAAEERTAASSAPSSAPSSTARERS
ncbi:MAG: ATP-binding cassette domain-containing protein [Actinomycetota bacterium]|nr:ATP-binding cassette domain-containing protein [Actinomycetota bacterium]